MASQEADAVSRFRELVIESFSAPDRSGRLCTYSQYLDLSPSERTDDEADIVDGRFARKALDWLGFTEGEITYNRHQEGKQVNRPDFAIHAPVGTAFVWEDKRTTEDFDAEEHVKQLARYTAGTPGYGVWTNASRILAFRFDPNGNYTVLADVNVAGVFGSQKLFPDEMARQHAGLQLLYLLFRKERFTRFEELIRSICVSEAEFLETAVPLKDERAQQNFISGAGEALEHLRIAALSRLYAAVKHRGVVDSRRAELHAEWEKETEKVRKHDEKALRAASDVIERVSTKLGDLEDPEMDGLREAFALAQGGSLPKALSQTVDTWVERTRRINAAVHAIRLIAGPQIYVRDAFIVWKERQPDAELATFEVFAQQAAYVFFIRMLLARTLEDKGLLKNRIASDGGFERWRQIVTFYFADTTTNIHAQSFIQLLAERVAMYYQHFFHQPVFDWFTPDDYMLVETLEFLNRYNFADVQSDILGFTYEQYIDRIARNKKGHFLTRPGVVGYMLDIAGYEGAEVIGRRVLDPACGSGSFLVSAARRYRSALVEAVAGRKGKDAADLLAENDGLRLEVAEKYVNALSTLLHGMDLDPFSCYLAELNLFICGLEDIHLLWEKKKFTPIERFHIYNTDSLSLPKFVLESTMPQASLAGQQTLHEDHAQYFAEEFSLADELVDEAYPLKGKVDDYSHGFYYVISNPPYVNRKQHPELDIQYRAEPFYAEALSGDMNSYLLFLRLGLYYLTVGGTMCYIVPLTLIGDRSAAAMRQLLANHFTTPKAIVRFYSGSVLFPGVDQATGIVCVTAANGKETVVTGGGYTVKEAKESERQHALVEVVSATQKNEPWLGAWLVSPSDESYRIWGHVRSICSACLGDLWERLLEPQQGDVNATYVRPFVVSDLKPSDIPLYEGESVFSYAPLPKLPPAWARPEGNKPSNTNQKKAQKALIEIRELDEEQSGLALRAVARLNTREKLNCTLFSRGPGKPLAFAHSAWRFVCKPDCTPEDIQRLLCVLNSRIVAYLLNLFSTNNNVGIGELGRIPIPPVSRLDTPAMVAKAEEASSIRSDLDTRFAAKYGMRLPDKDETCYLPPSRVLVMTPVPRVLLSDLELRSTVKPKAANLSIGTLLQPGGLEVTGSSAFRNSLNLLLTEYKSENWASVHGAISVPEPAHAGAFLRRYESLLAEAQQLWHEFEQVQLAVDELVSDWYGFNESMRNDLRQGLPWARRRRQ